VLLRAEGERCRPEIFRDQARGAVMRVSLLIPGLIGLVFAVTATAQPYNTPITTKFDGTYVIVSATMLTQTWKHGTGHCPSPGGPNLIISPLTITNGQITGSWTVAGKPAYYEGVVNVQGQFTSRATNPFAGTSVSSFGQINGDSTMYVRVIGWFCDWNEIRKRSPG
jgi:hypothetical protein